MKENLLEKKILKIKSILEKSKIIDDCCEVAKRSCNYQRIYSTDVYLFFYKDLAISYLEDKEINGIESGKELIVRYKTLEEVLHCDREDIKHEYSPIVSSEFGTFKVLKYLQKRGRWEKLIKKIKKKNIRGRKIEDKKRGD